MTNRTKKVFPLERLMRRATATTQEKARRMAAEWSFGWTAEPTEQGVVAHALVPASNRSPFKVRVSWNGKNLNTHCTCPVRRKKACSHRLALGILLHSYLEVSERREHGEAGGSRSADVVHSGKTQLSGEGEVDGAHGDQADGTLEDQADGTLEGQADGTLEDQADGTHKDQADGTLEDQAEGTLEDQAEGTLEDQADGTLEDQADGTLEDQADGTLEDQADGTHKDQADGTLEDHASEGQRGQRDPKQKNQADAEQKGPADLGRTGQIDTSRKEPTDESRKGFSKEVLDWVEVTIVRIASKKPKPCLVLSLDDEVVVGHLEFSYHRRAPRVSAARAESDSVVSNENTCYHVIRDRYAESQARWVLIQAGLRPSSPGSFVIEGLTLVEFTLEVAPKLKEKGWKIEGMKLLKKLKIRPLDIVFNLEVKKRINWFSFELSALAADVKVPLSEVLEAWRAGQKYLELKGGRLARVPTEWLEKSGVLLEDVVDLPEEGEGQRRMDAWQAPLVASLADAAGRQSICRDFQTLREGIEALEQNPAPELPRGLNATLRPYQRGGYGWLSALKSLGFGGILADDMGLGKTLQVLTLLLAATQEDASRRSLAVVPTSVVENWRREAERFAPDLKVVVFHGPSRRQAVGLEGADLVITSYGSVRNDMDYHLEQKYHYVVLDEAQAIKNPQSQTARACRQLPGEFRLTMTGTPIENRLVELWSQFAFLMPSLLGSGAKFQEKYVQAIERDGDSKRQAILKRRVEPFILRRLKEEVEKDLPPLTENVLMCDLAEDQAALYATTLRMGRDRIFQRLDGEGMQRVRFSVLELLLRLRQICCHPPLSGLEPVGRSLGSAKLELFYQTLEEILSEGHRVLVFSQFVQMLKVLDKGLETRGIQRLYLDGRSRKRQALVDEFNDSEIPVFLISLKAGGSGLNLTGADYVIHYDPWWNPAVEQQATDRAHRIGQTRPVFSYRLITRGTVEERMLELHARKKALVEGLLSADKAIGKSLTREDLEFLFADGAE